MDASLNNRSVQKCFLKLAKRLLLRDVESVRAFKIRCNIVTEHYKKEELVIYITIGDGESSDANDILRRILPKSVIKIIITRLSRFIMKKIRKNFFFDRETNAISLNKREYFK